jgi:hypothetical protein
MRSYEIGTGASGGRTEPIFFSGARLVRAAGLGDALPDRPHMPDA